MTNGNDPAFSKAAFYHPDGGADSPQEGLSKREYFAARALQGLLSNNNVLKFFQRDGLNPNDFIALVSQDSTAIADALIKALNETENKG